MKSRSLFVVGPPGVGKTTLVRGLLRMASTGDLPPGSYLTQKPLPKWTVSMVGTEYYVAAGHYVGGSYDGADTVGYGDVAKQLNDWRDRVLPRVRPSLTIFDGDRFSHGAALAEVAKHSEVLCLHLDVDERGLKERHALRGSTQNAAWVKGRITKAKRFATDFAGRGRRLFLQTGGVPPGKLCDIAEGFVRGEQPLTVADIEDARRKLEAQSVVPNASGMITFVPDEHGVFQPHPGPGPDLDFLAKHGNAHARAKAKKHGGRA